MTKVLNILNVRKLENYVKLRLYIIITPFVRILGFDWLIASVFFTNLLLSNEYRSFLTAPGYMQKGYAFLTLSAVVFAKKYSIRLDACNVTIINAFYVTIINAFYVTIINAFYVTIINAFCTLTFGVIKQI